MRAKHIIEGVFEGTKTLLIREGHFGVKNLKSRGNLERPREIADYMFCQHTKKKNNANY
jgi:hypothetical protein